MSDDLQQSLEREAQRIEERIPMAGQEDYTNIAARLRGFMDSRELSISQVARALDVSTSVVSQFLQSKYKGDNQTLANKIVNYINSTTRKERQGKGKPKHVDSTVAYRIKSLITNTESFCDEEGKIGLIIGDGGHGKSHCLRAYAQSNKNTVYVELDDAMTVRGIFKAIAGAVGLEEYGTQEDITRRIIDNLQNRQVIIMLDECSGLSVRQLNRLRQIIVVKSKCPLILAGNRGLLNTVMQATVRRGCESLDQFTSRLMAILNLDEVAADKDGGLYSVDDIRKLYDYDGVRLTGGAARAIKKICQTPRSGRLRTCSHIITALHTAKAIKQTGQITAENIVQAIVQLDLPVRVHIPLNTDWVSEDEGREETKTAVG